MRRYAFALGASLAAALGLCVLTAPAADDEPVKPPKEVTDALVKLIGMIDKGDHDAAKAEGEAIAKKYDLKPVMTHFKNRDKGGFGYGKEIPGNLTDGIESKLRAMVKEMVKKPPTKADVTKESKDLIELGERTAAIADIAIHKCPVDKKTGDKDPKDWKQWSEDMQQYSRDLIEAAKAKDPMKLKTAVSKLNSTCNQCHGTFRDD